MHSLFAYRSNTQDIKRSWDGFQYSKLDVVTKYIHIAYTTPSLKLSYPCDGSEPDEIGTDEYRLDKSGDLRTVM
jgi:hypothetical protein